MKINKDYATSIYDNVLPITDQQQTQFARDNTDKSTESLASYIAHSLSVSGMNVSTNWKDMCQYLDAKIVASRKTASF